MEEVRGAIKTKVMLPLSLVGEHIALMGISMIFEYTQLIYVILYLFKSIFDQIFY